MADKKKAVSELRVAKAQAAILEAANFTTEQIANLVGVSTPSVKRWRKDEEYQAMMQDAAERHLEDLHPVIERLKVEVVGAAQKAVGVLVLAMDKTDDEGFPHRNAIDSARAALTNMKMVTGDDPTDERGSGQTAVIVVSNSDMQAKPVDQVDSTAIEVPDTED